MLHKRCPERALWSISALIRQNVPFVYTAQEYLPILLSHGRDCEGAPAWGRVVTRSATSSLRRSNRLLASIVLRLRGVLLRECVQGRLLLDKGTPRLRARNQHEAALAQKVLNQELHRISLDQLLHRRFTEAKRGQWSSCQHSERLVGATTLQVLVSTEYLCKCLLD